MCCIWEVLFFIFVKCLNVLENSFVADAFKEFIIRRFKAMYTLNFDKDIGIKCIILIGDNDFVMIKVWGFVGEVL